MIDFLIDVLFTPGPVWVGLGLGILAAAGAWYLLPETMDRISIGAWFVGIGFIGGLVCCLPIRKGK